MRRRRSESRVGPAGDDEAATTLAHISYSVDADDTIVSTGGDWDTVAAESDAPELCDLGRVNLLASISDPTLQELWRLILNDVRASNRRHGFALRCDAPTLRRWLTLVVEPHADGSVAFNSVETSTEVRPYVGLLDRRAPRTDDLVKVCAWCGRAQAGGWVTIEEAVKRLGLFGRATMPRISHGICDDCQSDIMDEIGDASPGDDALVS